jgi:ATP-dependent DNA helicase RecG
LTGRGTRAGRAPEAPLSELRGVGPARAARLARLGLESVRDLLLLVPRCVVRQGAEVSVREAQGSVGRDVFVRGRLRRASLFRRGRRRSIVSTRLSDGTGELKVLWFNQPWMRERVEEHVRGDADVELCGRVVATSSGPALAAPRIGSVADPLR